MNKVFIIAEAGVNHNGDVKLAKKIIDSAKEAGADAIKFQSFITENLVTKDAMKANYQQITTGNTETQFEMLKRLELSANDQIELLKYANNKKIKFLSTPFDLDSVDLLNNLKLDIFKISSGDITNYPLLSKIGSLNKKIIISTGMCNLDEVKDALNILIKSGTKKDNITVLQCNTDYPTEYKDVNLRAMLTIKEEFNVKVGLSDHTPGIEISLAAVGMGAEVIEKHFTLDKNMHGPDHKASLNVEELKQLVLSIRNIEVAIGDVVKLPTESESKNISVIRKSIVALKDIKHGDVFSEDNLTLKRPGTGICPMEWKKVIGKKAIKDFKKDSFIEI